MCKCCRNIDNWDCSYFNDIESIRDFGTRNTETLGELCASFFRFWAWEFNYGRDAVSIRWAPKYDCRERKENKCANQCCWLIVQDLRLKTKHV